MFQKKSKLFFNNLPIHKRKIWLFYTKDIIYQTITKKRKDYSKDSKVYVGDRWREISCKYYGWHGNVKCSPLLMSLHKGCSTREKAMLTHNHWVSVPNAPNALTMTKTTKVNIYRICCQNQHCAPSPVSHDQNGAARTWMSLCLKHALIVNYIASAQS